MHRLRGLTGGHALASVSADAEDAMSAAGGDGVRYRDSGQSVGNDTEVRERTGSDDREVRERAAAYLLPRKTRAQVEKILAQLRSGLEDLYGDRLRGLYLFGSYARGEASPGSDIDVAIVLDHLDSSWDEIKRTSHLRAGLSLEHTVSVNSIWFSEREWEEGDTPFLQNVRKELVSA